ncbi:hypothetical protein B0T21DRAFT_349497 [Apiosordaria backusii]|uniref:Uncharacterized protein n=1 Tax=Apiosordaria backusii TaxID=314023 RepID=A0AA40BDZ6_9PEZI|nr:hypothetical protein B0T21DRAFT_349497 [Apiosordaria backusii]
MELQALNPGSFPYYLDCLLGFFRFPQYVIFLSAGQSSQHNLYENDRNSRRTKQPKLTAVQSCEADLDGCPGSLRAKGLVRRCGWWTSPGRIPAAALCPGRPAAVWPVTVRSVAVRPVAVASSGGGRGRGGAGRGRGCSGDDYQALCAAQNSTTRPQLCFRGFRGFRGLVPWLLSFSVMVLSKTQMTGEETVVQTYYDHLLRSPMLHPEELAWHTYARRTSLAFRVAISSTTTTELVVIVDCEDVSGIDGQSGIPIVNRPARTIMPIVT